MFHFINAGNLIKFDRFHVHVWDIGFYNAADCKLCTLRLIVCKDAVAAQITDSCRFPGLRRDVAI